MRSPIRYTVRCMLKLLTGTVLGILVLTAHGFAQQPAGDSPRPPLAAALTALEDREQSAKSLMVVESTLEALVGSPEDVEIAAKLLKYAARARFQRAETDQARAHLQKLHEVCIAAAKGRSPYQLSRWLSEVAYEHLRGGQLQEALQVLAEITDLGLPPQIEFDKHFSRTACTAGALSRRLGQLATDERYELLYGWTMPTESRRSVRVLTSIVPANGPPSAFARALGERPRDASFAVARVGDITGLFSTAWTLVESADGDREWTGLPENNATVEPLNRRGPKPLGLKSGDWNRVTLGLANNVVRFTLNGTAIYERRLEPENNRTFAFYHDRKRTAARARNVVMRGDCPERLTAEQFDNLAAISQPDQTPADRRALNVIFEDKYLADRALEVHRKAMKMPAEERYRYLAEWILPGHLHETFRLSSQFTATHPAAIAGDGDPIDAQRVTAAVQSQKTRVQTGGNLVAPALDLIDVAKQLGRLDAIRERIDRVPATNDDQRRSRFTMLALVDLASGNADGALANLEQLAPLAAANERNDVASRWPATLALWVAVRHSQTREIAQDLLLRIYAEVQKSRRSDSPAWDNQIGALIGLLQYLELGKESIQGFTAAPKLKQWAPVSYTTARTRGNGRPRAHWQRSPGRVDNFAGHEQDYLYFHVPLRGNFEVECDVTGADWRGSHLSVAGTWVTPLRSLKTYQFGDFRTQFATGSIEPPLSRIRDWLRYRVVVRHGLCTTYVNGRRIHERPLAAEHDPWVAIRSASRFSGAVRELRISGDPVIPNELKLAASPDLAGWLPYHGESIGQLDSIWRHQEGLMIGGRLDSQLLGSIRESLVRYHRPMLEDGSIEYEFFYRPGEFQTHPALDRLAFLLDPQGVRIHWITDGRYDRTGLDPANAFDEPENRRGPGKLPLKPDDWNRLQLTLTGNTVKLSLNGQFVYQRKLEVTNLRTFGLFHFSDRTEARVRNITWRGNWPRELPPVAEQELAGQGTDFLDDKLPELTAVFEHDFTTEGLPSNRFVGQGNGWENHVSVRPDGVHVIRPPAKRNAQYAVAPRVKVHGDFDITAVFDGLVMKLAGEGQVGVGIRAVMNNEAKNQCWVFRRHTNRPRLQLQHVMVATHNALVNGTRRAWNTASSEESTSGTLRLARRGDKVYFLFAEGDSRFFRLIAEETVTDDDVELEGIRLIAQSGSSGTVRVVWKALSIRAHKITGLPPE